MIDASRLKATLPSLVFLASVLCPAAVLAEETARVAGGAEAGAGVWPYQVALLDSVVLRKSPGDPGAAQVNAQFCAGTLVAPEWVLTAANCLVLGEGRPKPADRITVLVGATNLTAGRRVAAAEIVVHPGFDWFTHDNDIGLIRLAAPADKPAVELAEAGSAAGDAATVIGWGMTPDGWRDELMQADIHVQPESVCEPGIKAKDIEAIGPFLRDLGQAYHFPASIADAATDLMVAAMGDERLTSNMICGGDPDVLGNACKYDNGGPLLAKNGAKTVQLGIVSWRTSPFFQEEDLASCRSTDVYGIYTRVANYRGWIESTIAPPMAGAEDAVAVAARAADPGGHETERVFGGRSAAPGAWPFQVALLRSAELDPSLDSQYYALHCGGSLIAPQWVLTAAHCVVEKGLQVPADTRTVLIGATNLREGARHAVAAIFVNRNYDPATTDNDVALVKLAAGVATPTVAIASDNVADDGDATVIGWGKVESGEISQDLLEADLHVVPISLCNAGARKVFADDLAATLDHARRYMRFPESVAQKATRMLVANMRSDHITANMICAGDATGAHDACNGDSGGPLFVKDGDSITQVGIVSWGLGCGGVDTYGVYTRLGNYRDWIDWIIDENGGPGQAR